MVKETKMLMVLLKIDPERNAWIPRKVDDGVEYLDKNRWGHQEIR